jgi:TolB-like protein/class 3 adenylate cyclase/Tfp pilus assembly protein PilF
LSADVAGFSRLMGIDEVGTLRALTAHRKVVDGHIAQRGGRIVGTAGDSVLADFPSVVAALEAAVDIQRELAGRNAEVPADRRLEFRIGINLGDVIVEHDTVYGDGVNIAARLQALANPGGIYVSSNVYDQVRNKLALDFRPLGPQRVKNIAEPVRVYAVAGTPSASRARPRRSRRVALAGAAGGVAVAAALGWWLYPAPLGPPASGPAAPVGGLTSAVAARPVVAVLPFANLGDSGADDYFSDGLAEDVIGALGRFSDLAVIARNSAFSVRGRNLPADEIGKVLGARYLVEGSVRRAGDRVRVAVQLIEAESGQLRWSERYDSEIKDIFAVQDEITRGVVGALATRLTRLELDRTLVKPASNLAAYDLVLRGRQAHARGTRQSYFEARELFQKAIAADPSYAAAYVGLGHAYVNAVILGWIEDPAEALDRAERLGEQAVSLDDKDAWAHALLGRVYAWRRQYDAALRALDRAVALNPNKSEVLAERGEALVWSSKPEESIRAYETALRYDPNMPAIHLTGLGFAYYLVGRDEDALRVFDRAIRSRPDHVFSYVGSAAVFAQLGRREDAERAAEQVRRLHPFFEPALFGSILPDERHRARLAEGLAKAGIK